MKRRKTMTEILKFVVTKKKTFKFFYAIILFLSLFLITSKVGGCKPCFHPFYISFFASYFIHNFLLVTLFYYIYSLQRILDVKRMRIVHGLRTRFFF